MSIRYHQAPPVEVEFQFRASEDGTSVFEGYASIFSQPSKPIVDELARGGQPYIETVAPGAFKRTLGSGRRQSFVVDHDERMMISSSPSGPLRLAEDTRGLHVESPWPRTHYADNVRALYDAGERLGMSMLFGTPKGGDSWERSGSRDRRTVNEAILKHVSVLATMEPAYSGTVATFRALAEQTESDAEDIEALVDALREGRKLDDGEFNLLNRLADAVKPEAGESAQAEESVDEAGRAALSRWTDRLAQIDSELPRS